MQAVRPTGTDMVLQPPSVFVRHADDTVRLYKTRATAGARTRADASTPEEFGAALTRARASGRGAHILWRHMPPDADTLYTVNAHLGAGERPELVLDLERQEHTFHQVSTAVRDEAAAEAARAWVPLVPEEHEGGAESEGREEAAEGEEAARAWVPLGGGADEDVSEEAARAWLTEGHPGPDSTFSLRTVDRAVLVGDASSLALVRLGLDILQPDAASEERRTEAARAALQTLLEDIGWLVQGLYATERLAIPRLDEQAVAVVRTEPPRGEAPRGGAPRGEARLSLHARSEPTDDLDAAQAGLRRWRWDSAVDAPERPWRGAQRALVLLAA